MSSSYTVLVDKDVVINSLVIGYGNSSIQLTIDSGVTFDITGSMGITRPTVTVLGHLVVDNLHWSGKYLNGSTSVGSSLTNGQVTVSSLFLVEHGLYDQ